MSDDGFIPLDFRELPEGAMVERSRELLAELSRRRTVRDYSDRPVPMEVIENALRIAGSAPSGANMQPWQFVVVTDPEKKKAIREAAEEEERAFYSGRAPDDWLEALAPLGTDAEKPFLETAPCLIAIFASRYTVDADGKRHKHYYTPESVGIATGMLIAALHLCGLATLTHTPSPMKFLNELLDRPGRDRPFLLLVVGYPAEDAQVPDITRKALAEIADFR